MVFAISRFVLNVCLLRATPADAPSQLLALAVAAALYMGLGTYGFSLLDNTWPPWLPALQGLLILAAATRALLAARGLVDRFPQTLFTLLATSTLLGAVAMLLELGFPPAGQADPNPPIATAWLALFCWSFVVDAYIFKHALERSMALALLIAVALFAVHQMLLAAWYLPATQT